MRVLLVDIDSLRPDHLGCYGYERATSPTIDSIAADGVTFDNCYVSDSPCLPSRTALATGRHGIKTGVVTHYGSGQWYDEPGEGHAPDQQRPLGFRYLSEAGIHTTTVTTFGNRHLAYHFPASFRESIQPAASMGREQAADVTETATNWLEDHATEADWLLHVNYWDVHHPYEQISEYVDTVGESGPVTAGPDQETIDSQQEMTGTRCASFWANPDDYERDGHKTGAYADWPMPESISEREQVETLLEGYDASIRLVDDAVATLLDTLEAAGVREETAVVITADHGEALGEHGIYAEHAMPHPPCQRVPMIVSWPGVTEETADTVQESQIHQFDLLATLCDAFDIDVPTGWDSESFYPALAGDSEQRSFEGREYLVCGHGIYTFGRAVYRDNWVYIRLLHPGVFSLPGVYNDQHLSGDGLELLHDTEADPYLEENLIEANPDIAEEFRGVLDDWTARMQASEDAAGEDPLRGMAAEDGPFLYVDPEPLAALYETSEATTETQLEAIRRAREFDGGSGVTESER